jgi:glycosyltransferase involved in cell wall biosynthesis
LHPDRPQLAIEISPLGERHHTGIANVTKHLVKAMLNDDSIDAHFFFNRDEVPRALVERALTLEDGSLLWWLAARAGGGPELSYDPDRMAIGIYPGHKWHRRLFPTEVLIVHDITTLLAPHFHTEESVEFWQAQHLGDMLSSELLVAVSQSTKDDVMTYYPQLAQTPCIVAPLASTTSERPDDIQGGAEPYVLVLGTIEPRKNVEVVLECLSRRRDLLEKMRFVFVGRWGWGPDSEKLIEDYALENAVASGRVLFTGFVSDEVRDELMAQARCVLYISHYEGFGLPVLEALSLGTPVLTGIGSSLPEVGGDVATFCDVNDADAVGGALTSLLTAPDLHSPEARHRRRDWAAQFQWSSTYKRIRDAAIDIAARS